MAKQDSFFIVNASPYCIFNGKNYIDPAEYISLSQWFGIFEKITLLRPVFETKDLPNGWVEVPEDINVIRLCKSGDSRLRRFIDSRFNAKKFLTSADVVYIRMPNYEGYWTYKIAKKLQIKLLLELHGDWSGSIQSEDSNSIIRFLTRGYRAKQAEKAVRSMVNYSSLLITIGPALAIKYSDIHLPVLVTTNHLLPASSYFIRKNFALHSPPRLIFIGDIQRRKGLPYLFESLAQLKKLKMRFELLLVGDGPLMKELTNYAEKFDFLDSIIFKGRVPYGKQLIDLIKDSDLLILPSIGSEGVPRVTHEAMAVGCPVIAANVGSISWQLAGEAGVLVMPCDSRGLAEAILKVLKSQELREALSKKGRNKADQFTFEMQIEKLQHFIGTCL